MLALLLFLSLAEIAIVGWALATYVESNFWCFTFHFLNVAAVAVVMVTTMG